MTANVLPTQVVAIRQSGMNDHVGKPFKRQQLLQTIDRWMKSSDTAPVAQPEPRAASEAFDPEVLEQIAELAGAEQTKAWLGTLKDVIEGSFAVNPRDLGRDQLIKSAHALVSQAGMLGFTELSQQCRALEEACLKGESTTAVLERVQESSRAACAQLATLLAREDGAPSRAIA